MGVVDTTEPKLFHKFIELFDIGWEHFRIDRCIFNDRNRLTVAGIVGEYTQSCFSEVPYPFNQWWENNREMISKPGVTHLLL